MASTVIHHLGSLVSRCHSRAPADEAVAAAEGLVDAAEASRQPVFALIRLLAEGSPSGTAEPERARKALRRGLEIAQDSGNRFNVSHLAAFLGQASRRRSATRWRRSIRVAAIRNYHDAGSPHDARSLAILSARVRPAGTLRAGGHRRRFRPRPATTAAYLKSTTAIAHLREVLGDTAYQSLAKNGAAMTISAITTYAYEQIDHARAEIAQSP